MEVESIRPVFGKHDSSDTKQDNAYGTLPLENSDQNTSKDNSFKLISSPDSEVAKISQEIEAQGKAHDLVHS